jgi:hypothetical protein
MEGVQVKKTFFVGLVITLVMTIYSGSLAGASPILSTEFNNTMFITDHNESITFSVYSSIGTTGVLYINQTPNAFETPNYKAEVTSKTDSQYDLTVTPLRPLDNGTHELKISTDSNGSNAITLTYTINVDLDAKIGNFDQQF